MALAAGVMGLVSVPLFCCGSGLSGALAAVLGMMALDRIRASGGALRGRTWAWTGVLSGLLTIAISVGWFSWVNTALQVWNGQLDDGIRSTFSARTPEDARAAIQSWSGKSSAGVSTSSLEQLADDTFERLGALESISLVSQEPSPGELGTLMVVHIVNLGFEKATVSGAVYTELRPPAEGWTPVMKLVKIHLNDATAPDGMIEFPARPDAGAANATRDKEVAK